MALSRGIRLHQYLDDWLLTPQSQEKAPLFTRIIVELTESLDWILNQKK